MKTATKLSLFLLIVMTLSFATSTTASACWKRRCHHQVQPIHNSTNHYGSNYITNYDTAQYYNALQTQEGYQQAFAYYEAAAEEGDSRAAYRLAQIYEQGLYGTPCNKEKAAYWYQQSTDSRAQNRLVQLGQTGQGLPCNRQQSLAYYTQAAEMGDGRAIYRLSQNYKALADEPIEQWGTTNPHKDKATYWLKESAKAGDGRSQYQLARAYHTGQYPIGRNLEQARYWYTKSALQGDARSQFYLAQLYEFGGAGLENKPKAYAWYRIAKEQGHGWAVTPFARISKQLKVYGLCSEGLAEYQAAQELR